MVYNLAVRLNNFTVTAMTFQKFRKTYKKWKKMRCNSPFLVVTHSDNGTKEDLEKVSRTRLFYRTYWLIFIKDRTEMEDFFRDVITPFDLRMVVAETKYDDRIDFFEVYRVLQDRPLRTPHFGSWRLGEGYKLGSRNIYERRQNLEGIVLKTGSTNNYPMNYFVPQTDGTTKLEGFFAEVWSELERILNFSSINYPSVDKVEGIPENNGKWSGLVGMLQRREIDAAVSNFLMDAQRSRTIDFTRPLMRSSYQIFFKSMGNTFNWDAILRPFKKDIWLTICGWIILCATFYWLSHIFTLKYGLESATKRDDFTLINSGLFFVKALCNQAALIYFLTSRSPVRPFDSLRGLLETNTYKLQTIAKTAHYIYFSSSTNPLLHKIYLELIQVIPEDQLPLSTEEALDKVCKERNLAHFGDIVNAITYVKEINSKDSNCKIMYLSKEISPIYSSIGLTRDSPYKFLFNHFLHKIIDAGIINKLQRNAFQNVKHRREVRTWGVIESKDVFQAFAILAIGLLLSTIVFTIEILYFRTLLILHKKSEQVKPAFHMTRNIYHFSCKEQQM
ncbi:UNVERIFIED_CONTAM: hypothetical protein PYX00_007100 [Menopon gallinae]|uniref:Ionotropic glutamate receptor C-terminal domain-containing protein n=1 Tax=Menopon gallinae TaxID=328185 RepID=A0AAW2HHS6_9NEOP